MSTPAISPGATAILSALLEARTGQQLAANRAWRIETALRPLVAELGFADIDQLTARLLEGQDQALGDRIVDALLNQETSFFRDAGVVEAAARALTSVAQPGRRARVWCAACATGQEPLSLAMTLLEGEGEMPEILATDVSAGAITRARAGVYSQFEIQRGLPVRRMIRWFDGDASGWQASPALLATIGYRRHNLVSDPAPAGRFDLILCRNILFYLSPPAREAVLERLATALQPGGLLLLGAGETVIGQTVRLRPSAMHRGFYERVDAAAEPIRAAR